MLKTRTLGSGAAALKVSEMGLGCMGMSAFYGELVEEESLLTIHRAIELGVTFLDTADMYGVGKNEELISRAISDRRDQVTIATKFGNRVSFAADGSIIRTICGTPEYVKQACDASLKRLGIDTIDLYYQHRVDRTVPIEETVGAMAELVKEGKVRFLGLSEASSETIRRAHAVHPITALQSEYSITTRVLESDVLPTIRELGIGLVAYSPLGRGMLAGQFKSADQFAKDDFRSMLPRFSGENFEHNLTSVNRLEVLAQTKGVTISQLALAWVMAKGDDIVPIPGTKRRKYLEENAAAAAINLSPADVAEIEAAMPIESVLGSRYPDQMMASLEG